jgi:hypothetical protein
MKKWQLCVYTNLLKVRKIKDDSLVDPYIQELAIELGAN